MSLIHKMFSALLLLCAITDNVHADYFPEFWKNASELTPEMVKAAHPNVLLCMLPSAPGVDAGDILGRVTPGAAPGTFVCEYTQLIGGIARGPFISPYFEWLDVTYEELSIWLTSLAAPVEKNDQGYFFVIRHFVHNPQYPEAICIKPSLGTGFEIGYETISPLGVKLCDALVGAVYVSPFFRSAHINSQKPVIKALSQCDGHDQNGVHCSASSAQSDTP